ncbi:transposase [Streptomyces sp. NPDC048255]|uniref:transposase n=1 Tax=Streptomyces sp. NPDC048255 TaxID=3154713 RepID=UPI0033DD8FA6
MPSASRGYDGGRKMPGRKRHIVTNTLGLLLAVAVTAANIGDRDAAVGLLSRLRRLHRDITLVWADGGYTCPIVDWCRQKLALTLEIVKRTDAMEGFVVLPRRWVVERTFAWLMNSRRLARDHETLPATRRRSSRRGWSCRAGRCRPGARPASGPGARTRSRSAPAPGRPPRARPVKRLAEIWGNDGGPRQDGHVRITH